MAFMNFGLMLSAAAEAVTKPELTNIVGKFLLILREGVGDFGWTVVLFAVLLKLVMSPLDIWQKISGRKQSLAMQKMQPQLEKLQKQYANNPNMLRQKQAELQKSAGMSMLSSCLPMIISLVIFWVVFAGFRALIAYENQMIVYNLYIDVYLPNVNLVSAEELNALLAQAYKPEGWLWISNVFMPDSWSNVIPTFSDFVSNGMGKIGTEMPAGIMASYDTLVGPAAALHNKTKFWDMANWNGYLILPVLSIAFSFLSTKLMQKYTPQQQTGSAAQQKSQQNTMKIMNYLMPVMLGVFSVLYSAAFAIYYFISNVVSIIINLAFNIAVSIKDKKASQDSTASSRR